MCTQVIGPAKYKKLVHAEIDRVLRLKTCGKAPPWRSRGEGLEGGPYEAKFGDRWETEMRDKLRRTGSICVIELMEHVIRWGTIMYADTIYAHNWYVFPYTHIYIYIY